MNATTEGIRDHIDCVQWCARKSGVALAMHPDFHDQHRLEQCHRIDMAWSLIIRMESEQ